MLLSVLDTQQKGQQCRLQNEHVSKTNDAIQIQNASLWSFFKF